MIYELNFNEMDNCKKIEEFLARNNSDYMQSIMWNKIRTEKNKYFVFYEENNEIIFSCSLFEKIISGKSYLYAPRGPVLNNCNYELFNVFLEKIKIWMYGKGYKDLIINPYLKEEDLKYISNKYSYTIIDNNSFDKMLDSCKLACMDIVFNEEKMIQLLCSKHRQNTRRSYRKKSKYKVSKEVDLDNFYDLYLQTSDRHSFNPHDINYFKKIIKEFKKNLIFIEVWNDDKPLAMSIDIIYNNKLIYLYGVSSSSNRNLLGMYCLQWEAIKYCINNKIPIYDFGGVFCSENDKTNKDYGLYTFKRGYCYKGFIDVVPDIIFDFGGMYD